MKNGLPRFAKDNHIVTTRTTGLNRSRANIATVRSVKGFQNDRYNEIGGLVYTKSFLISRGSKLKTEGITEAKKRISIYIQKKADEIASAPGSRTNIQANKRLLNNCHLTYLYGDGTIIRKSTYAAFIINQRPNAFLTILAKLTRVLRIGQSSINTPESQDSEENIIDEG